MRPNEMSPESEKEAILHKYETVNNALSQKETEIYKKERELSGARSDFLLANLNLEIEKGKNRRKEEKMAGFYSLPMTITRAVVDRRETLLLLNYPHDELSIDLRGLLDYNY